MKINLLPQKQVKRVAYKTLNIMALIALVFNMSMVGVFFAPKEAQANGGGYTFELTAPTPPTASDTFTWELDGSKPGPGEEISHFSLDGCWSEDDIVTVNGSTSWDWSPIDPPGGQEALKFDPPNSDDDLPFGITIVFNQSFPSTGSVNGWIKQGNTLVEYEADGPDCTPPPPECELEITKKVTDSDETLVEANTAAPGEILTYTINYENVGDAVCTGTGVKVYDPLHDYLTYVNDSRGIVISNDSEGDGYHATQGNDYNGKANILLYNVNRVSPDESGVITFQATVTEDLQCGEYDIPNKAKIWSNETDYIWSNQVDTHVVAECPLSFIQGKKFNDKNANSTRDGGDTFMDNWTIRLYDDNWSQVGSDHTTGETGTLGQYKFDNLALGTYYVCEVQKNGWSQTKPSSVANQSGVGGEAPYCFEVTIDTHGQEVTGKQFGNHRDTGEVTFEKIVTSGTNNPSEWTFEVDGTFYNHGQTTTFPTDTYTVTEHGPNGYVNTNISGICSTTQTTEVGSMTVTENGGTCTFTNAEDTGSLKIIKYVDEGDATPDMWDFTVAGYGTQSPASGQNYTIFTDLPTGSYSATESTVTGYNQVSTTCNDVQVVYGQTAVCEFHNTRDTGDLKIIKQDEHQQRQINVEFDIDGQTYYTDNNGEIYLDDVATGDHIATETEPNNYTFTSVSGLNCTNSNPSTATVVKDTTTTCTFTNTRDSGNIKVNKEVDTNGDGTFNGRNTEAANLGFVWGLDSETPARAMGSSETVVTGTYDVTENDVGGFHFVGWYTNGSDYTCETTTYNSLPANILVNHGATTEITLCNARDTGDLLIKKYNDLNENGKWNEGEPMLEGWTFNVSQNSASKGGGTTDANGELLITNLPTGDYDVTESLMGKWLNTTNLTQTATVVTNQTTTVMFGNAEEIVTLDLDKSNDKAVVNPLETINYRIDWSIDGNSTAVNVILTDILPVEIEVDEATISDGGTYDAATRTITWDFGNQKPGASGYVTYTVTTIDTLESGTEIINVARIAADNTDPKFKEDDTTVLVEADPVLTIDKTVNVETFVNPGDEVTYTVVVTNIGDGTAYNVELIDLLPIGFTFTELGTSSHSWSLGDMAAGDSITITYDVTISEDTEAGFYDNYAVASADNHKNISDEETVEVRVPEVLAEEAYPLLEIVKSVDKEFINAGDVVTFTVKVTNVGDASAFGVAVNVQVQDVMPAGFTFEDGEVTKVWALGDLAIGESAEISYTAVSDTTITPGMYENLAIAWADNHEKISDTEDVEVKAPVVLGEELPITGGTALHFLYVLGAIILLGISGYILKLTSSKEQS